MNNLLTIITPVIAEMKHPDLKEQLLKAFPRMEEDFLKIETAFQSLTSSAQPKDVLCSFFHSWSQTNNSAVTVAGLSNRMTMLIHKEYPVPNEQALFRSVASLNRIVDEDLAVVGQILHSILFYRMATGIIGDDQWLSHQYLRPEAKAFKDWKDKNSLRNKDIMIGLLTTLVHEIYTHGEVEYILPRFEKWLKTTSQLSDKEITTVVAWIRVHCGPTEKNHFFHAVDAIIHYAEAMELDVAAYDLQPIVEDYLRQKAEVMHVLQKEIEMADIV